MWSETFFFYNHQAKIATLYVLRLSRKGEVGLASNGTCVCYVLDFLTIHSNLLGAMDMLSCSSNRRIIGKSFVQGKMKIL